MNIEACGRDRLIGLALAEEEIDECVIVKVDVGPFAAWKLSGYADLKVDHRNDYTVRNGYHVQQLWMTAQL